jgi:hypothetical protein
MPYLQKILPLTPDILPLMHDHNCGRFCQFVSGGAMAQHWLLFRTAGTGKARKHILKGKIKYN